MVRLIAMDFDFTLVDYPPHGEHRICEALLDRLEGLAALGVRAGVVSGRTFESLKDALLRAGVRPGSRFPSFLICQDAYVHQTDGTGAWVAEEAHNASVRSDMLTAMQELLPLFHQCMDLLSREGIAPREWKIIGDGGLEWVAESPAHAQKGLDALRPFAQRIDINRNHHLINLVPKGHGKGVALRDFAGRLGIAPEEVLAVGDSLNDLSMLDGRFGLRGGAVGNADPIVRAAVERAGGSTACGRASYGLLEILDRHAASDCLPGHTIEEERK